MTSLPGEQDPGSGGQRLAAVRRVRGGAIVGVVRLPGGPGRSGGGSGGFAVRALAVVHERVHALMD
ncbi:hypothetical protein ACFRAR_38510, partial [Kitasatospora sp. NPDC056651]|uniref:hypothetical protein n=1 Tax=Kitasatospora sp. NPDC056651 TaxID=3345892 RepID=UPI003691CC03